MTVLDWQMDIYDRLRTGLPNTPVHLEGVSESEPHPRDPTGLIKPFLILWFGQLTDVTSFAGTVGDLCGNEDSEGNMVKQGHFLVETVAPTGLSLLQLENLVRSLMTGFRPSGEGELTESGQTSIRDPLPTGIGDTLRFYKPLFFMGTLTASTVPLPAMARPVRQVPTRMTLQAGEPVGRDTCPEGHVLYGENLIEEKRGGGKTVRRCRTCVNNKARDNYARRRKSEPTSTH